MNDSDLKKLLLETCQVRPGQEDRAWTALRSRLSKPSLATPWAWIYLPTWRGATIGFAAVALAAFLGNSVLSHYMPISYASANSEVPGIFATSFYSHSAQAQVVWLNGLEPATDKPTYLDPTTDVTQPPKGEPNSL